MTKKDFFRLIIKIFGLYSVITVVFSVIPANISFVIRDLDFVGFMWLIGTVIVIFSLFGFLIYKPDKIIGWLKLDKGFDDDRIDFQKFNNSNILKLAVIVIGGILLIDNIPSFLSRTLLGFKSAVGNNINDNVIKYSLKDYIYWGTSFLNILIGYFMLTNYSYISKILKGKDNEEEKEKKPLPNKRCYSACGFQRFAKVCGS